MKWFREADNKGIVKKALDELGENIDLLVKAQKEVESIAFKCVNVLNKYSIKVDHALAELDDKARVVQVKARIFFDHDVAKKIDEKGVTESYEKLGDEMGEDDDIVRLLPGSVNILVEFNK